MYVLQNEHGFYFCSPRAWLRTTRFAMKFHEIGEAVAYAGKHKLSAFPVLITEED